MFTEEQQKAIDDMLAKQKQQLESDFEDKISGLKGTNAAMKQEKLELAEKAEAKALELEQKAIDAAKEAGKFQEALELERAQYERKHQDLAKTLEDRNNLILSSEKKAAVSGIVSNFAKNDKLSQLTASQLVDYSFNDEGSVVASFKDLDGNVVADSHDKWLDWAKTDPDMQNHLAGSKASGTDYKTVSPSSTSQDKNDYSKMSNDDKLSYLENVQLK
jgi:hypothetical protein